MLKYILIGLLLFNLVAFSCDQCNVFVDVYPGEHKDQISLVYRQRSMAGLYSPIGEQILTKHASHGNNPQFWNNHVNETYRTFEFRGSWNWNTRNKLTVVFPLLNNRLLINSEEVFTIQGLGDPIVLNSIEIVRSEKELDRYSFIQILELSGGVKFPLGKIDKEVNETTPNLDLQPGTGSIDVIGMIHYKGRFDHLGYSVLSSVKYNFKNENDYRYGIGINSKFSGFWQTKIKNQTWLIMAGISSEIGLKDESFMIHEDTGGKILYSDAKIGYYFKSINGYIEYQHAIKNQMAGYSQLITRNRLNVGVTYNF